MTPRGRHSVRLRMDPCRVAGKMPFPCGNSAGMRFASGVVFLNNNLGSRKRSISPDSRCRSRDRYETPPTFSPPLDLESTQGAMVFPAWRRHAPEDARNFAAPDAPARLDGKIEMYCPTGSRRKVRTLVPESPNRVGGRNLFSTGEDVSQ